MHCGKPEYPEETQCCQGQFAYFNLPHLQIEGGGTESPLGIEPGTTIMPPSSNLFHPSEVICITTRNHSYFYGLYTYAE